jgi:hypothetical protein
MVPRAEENGEPPALSLAWSGPRLVHTHRNRAIHNDLQRCIVHADRRRNPGQQDRVENPDKDEVCPGLHRPCRTRPADRSLVAEDRSAGGVRDRTGPAPRSALGPWRTGTTGARAVSNGPKGQRGTAGYRPSNLGSGLMHAGDSDCGPEGRGSSPSPQELPRACGPCPRGKWSPRTGLTQHAG